jgi:hypothetical protein
MIDRRRIAGLLVALAALAGAPSASAAPDPDPATTAATPPEKWWAFQPLRPTAPPTVPGTSQPAHPIDAFIRARLAARNLRPNPPAARRVLLRRVYFDLIGLPPAPEEIAAFENDRSPEAWARVIDGLLARPQYGERWGRHWLDVVRFAQSNGYERDGEKPQAWRYRDYVVQAFNEDKPYDQFVREQLAGDELEPVTTNGLVATGFQRLGVWDDEPDDKRMAEFDELDDVLSTTGSAFLGMTIGCARCHEHKFDPITQGEYYQLLGFFRNLRPSEAARFALDSANYVPLVEPVHLQAWQAGQQARIAPLQARLAATTNVIERKSISKEIDGIKNAAPPFEWALAARERDGKPPATHVLARGDASRPGAEVQPGFPAALGALRGPPPPTSAAAIDPERAAAQRRRALAEWIASPQNALTARVLVNRVWQHHFGKGIVPTTSDFGHAGLPPTHPELLDWLASQFITHGWSIKQLHRLILQSETYQQSSDSPNAQAVALDPANDLLGRQNLRRLEAEALRDTILAINGRLNLKMGGRGFFPRLSGEVLAGQSRPGLDWEISSSDELNRRSLYAYVRRTMPVPMLDVFDYSNTTSPLNERPVTTVASQSLLLLNDEFMQDQAAALAERLVNEVGPRTESIVERGFARAVGRQPTRDERRRARQFIARQEKEFTRLRERLTFRPDVPTSLAVSYMDALTPQLFLRGPTNGWSYHRGRWSAAYEGIRTVERERGPFALASFPSWSNGTIQAVVTLHKACESVGLLFRATAVNHALTGYELALDPREERVTLRYHTNDLLTLASARATLPTGRAFSVRIEAHNARFRVWLDDNRSPLLDTTDPHPRLQAGQAGLRAWGAAVSLDHLAMQPAGELARVVVDPQRPPPARQALQSFALLLLNLNEVVYVD